jgi:hypothetical protein
VVLLAKVMEEGSQPTGMLLPSSSSSESGARVQAGPGVSLLNVLLSVTDVVVVSKWSLTLHPKRVTSKTVWHVEDDEVDVEIEVDTTEESVVAETAEDRYRYSPQ